MTAREKADEFVRANGLGLSPDLVWIRAAYLAARREAAEECARCVPTTWLDPLLTGPNRVIPSHIAAVPVQDLLNAIRDRIRALGSES